MFSFFKKKPKPPIEPKLERKLNKKEVELDVGITTIELLFDDGRRLKLPIEGYVQNSHCMEYNTEHEGYIILTSLERAKYTLHKYSGPVTGVEDPSGLAIYAGFVKQTRIKETKSHIVKHTHHWYTLE